jgi:hypothetical protein
MRLILAALLAALFSSGAFAHGHGRVGVGVYVGPTWGPWYYPPYYYSPPLVVVQQPPPVYVEQAPVQAPAPAPQQVYWYYCPTSNGYYPHVKECPAGWLKVLPESPR